MRRQTALTIALVFAAVAAVPLVGMAASGDTVAQTSSNDTNNSSVAPGERLSGVVGVQGAELEGEVDQRAFGLKVAQAATDDAKAKVVNETLADLEQRVKDLDERKQELKEARENGSMSEGEYRAKVSELAAKGKTVKQLANKTSETAGALPADVLEANGVNVSAIETLKNNAKNLTGPEIAEIARSIAGPNIGEVGPPEGVPVGGPGDAGPGDRTPANPDGDTTGTDTPDGTDTQTDTDTPTDTPGGQQSGNGY